MSAVISADTQRLSGVAATPIWTTQSDFTVACWVKVTAAQWGDIFCATDNGNYSYSHAALRNAPSDFDHDVTTQSVGTRLDYGATGSTWRLIGITSEAGVACVSYIDGADVYTLSGAKAPWSGGLGFDAVYIGYFSLSSGVGQHSGRSKIAHCAVWDKKLTSGEWADLYNGGAGGYGKNPQAVAAANLKYYSALTSDATVEIGGITLTNTGSVTFDGADNPTVEAYGADTTAPTLSSASVTSVGATTATGNISTDEGNGTLYSVVSTSATAPSAAQIQAGNDHTGSAAVWSGNQAISSTGAKTLSITGLTASTSYYAHFQHKDAANNNSTVVTSAQFTTGSVDTTSPTMTGSVTISAKTTTSYTASWSAGSDNVAVTGYEYRLNASSWVDLGNVLTTNISGRTPGATDTFEVRAYDAAGNRATALSQSITLFIGTITIPAVKDWGTGNLKTAQTSVQVDIHNISTGALVVRKTGQTTHATTGVCVVQDAAIADATTYEVITRFADGSKGMWDYTASLT